MKNSLGRLVTVTAALAAAAGCSPPSMLNALNAVTPGESGVGRVARAVPFTDEATALDIWVSDDVRDGGTSAPVLVFFYGGGWADGERGEYGFVARAYAARGFVVVVPDYRKVPDVRFPAFLEDGAAAIRWTRSHIERYGGDPDRIVLAGHSAGAYIAVQLALDPHYLHVERVPDDTIKAVAALSGPYDFYPFTSERAEAAFGDWPEPAATQPVSFARADAPPLWLATGTDDQTVRPRNSERLAAAQQAAGSMTTELKLYPDLSHADPVKALSKPFRGTAPVLEDSIAFFERHGITP
ncbi:MAG: alpha/beta hydrolase [Pseudomonadota bacterium]